MSTGVQHALTVTGLAAAIALQCIVGWRLRARPVGLRRYEHGLAVAVAALWIGYFLFDLTTKGWDPRRSLPLQLCDFAAIVAMCAFARPSRGAHALAYFWGLALSTQALVTPDLVGGPNTLAFWAFWLYHLFVVGAGVYVVVVRRFRPELRDLLTAVGAGLLYVAVIFAVDAAFDVNYGYLGRAKPGRPTLLDVLGPWPLRVVNLSAIAIAAMTLLWLPWALRRSRRA